MSAQRPPRPLLVASLVAISLSACAEEPAGPDAPSIPAFAAAPSRAARGGLDARFARVARDVPGFGGAYFGDDGSLRVVMAGRDAAPGDRAADIRRALGRHGLVAASEARFVIEEGEHDFSRLVEWRDRSMPQLAAAGALYVDVDERSNRLVVAVAEGHETGPMAGALAVLDVPPDAVEFRVSEPIVPLVQEGGFGSAGPGSTLNERRQPFGGGIQLAFPNPMPGFISLCTLGFNVGAPERGRSILGFVTNSHCSEAQGVTDGTPYFQQPVAPLTPAFRIGEEVADPSGVPCFGAFLCRLSDAGIALYDRDATPVRFGAIYRTESFGAEVGSTILPDGAPDFFAITAEAPFPLGGEMLDKVGWRTGWTRGPVIATCVNVLQSGTPWVYLCQDLVLAGVGPGDSGSPVFRQTSDREATLYGVLWGGAGGLFVFSAMENIRLEFGAFRTH